MTQNYIINQQESFHYSSFHLLLPIYISVAGATEKMQKIYTNFDKDMYQDPIAHCSTQEPCYLCVLFRIITLYNSLLPSGTQIESQKKKEQ